MSAPPTPGEVALAEASVTIGGMTMRLTDLTHSTPLTTWGGVQRPSAVRVFPKNRAQPWLEEEAGCDDEARARSRQIDRVLRFANGTSWPVTCCECGESKIECFFQDLMRHLVAERLCHSCNFWREKVAMKDDPKVARVGGWHHVDSGNQPNTRPELLGCAGRKFRIRWNDGREVVTNNVWVQGEIPAHFRERLPDNAIFVKEQAHAEA